MNKGIYGIILFIGYVLHWVFMIKQWEHISFIHSLFDIVGCIIVPVGGISGYVHYLLTVV